MEFEEQFEERFNNIERMIGDIMAEINAFEKRLDELEQALSKRVTQ